MNSFVIWKFEGCYSLLSTRCVYAQQFHLPHLSQADFARVYRALAGSPL